MHVENLMKWKNQVEQFLPKLSAACFLISRLIHTFNLDNLYMVYFVYFYSVLHYLIIFRGNSTHAYQVFKLQRRTFSVMSGVQPSSLYRSLLRKLNILHTANQNILCLMLFVVDNQKDFPANPYAHGLDTRKKNHLHLPIVSLSCVKKSSFILQGRNL